MGGQRIISYTTKLITLIQQYELLKYDLQAVYPKCPFGTIYAYTNFLTIIWLQHNLNLCLIGVKGFVPLVVDGVYETKTKAAVLLYWKQLGWDPFTGWSAGVNTKTALVAGEEKLLHFSLRHTIADYKILL